MKIMYIDMSLDGHHRTYLQAFIKIPNVENVLVLPERLEGFWGKQYIYEHVDFAKKRLLDWIIWTRKIRRIIEIEKPDVINFPYTDMFYRFFGIGLEGLKKKYCVIQTCHWLREEKLRVLSLSRIAKLSSICIFHTEINVQKARALGISNVVHIECPQFSSAASVSKAIARKYFGIQSEKKVLGCIGGTRNDKGLDILLTALQNVDADFELLIAGSEQDFMRAEIEELIAPYQDNVHLHLKYLSTEELEMAFQALDIIVVPYRKRFNGASGPLGEGAGRGKMIIGSNHGSIGDIISRHHLGYTFETENIASLSSVLNKALRTDFSYDSTAQAYQKSLSVEYFLNAYEALYRTDIR